MNLYLRLFLLLFRLIGLPRKGLLEGSRVAFRVLPNDCDMEQKFESQGVLCAHAFVKGLFLDANGRVSNAAVAAEMGYAGEPPPFPDELRIWAQLGNIKKQKA